MLVTKLDVEDISTIKHALLEHKSMMLLSFFMNSVMFGGLYFILIYKNSEHLGWPRWLIYLVLSLPFFSFSSTIIGLKNFLIDLKEHKKNVVKSRCKRFVSNSESGDIENLWIEDYKQIELSTLDANRYRDILPENQVFDCEIHIAPRSKAILKLLKIENQGQ
ncbi:MAG: hypothetical protein IT258_17850 [Saprospiraceae bacterium]|nr:hypothetical protein [Saprospiraceae bacterium]